ncbi:MAG: hypothetical protein ABSG13_31560, partial [Bryobacteraceae bacterium]
MLCQELYTTLVPNPKGMADRRSKPGTWVTVLSGDMGNTLLGLTVLGSSNGMLGSNAVEGE